MCQKPDGVRGIPTRRGGRVGLEELGRTQRPRGTDLFAPGVFGEEISPDWYAGVRRGTLWTFLNQIVLRVLSLFRGILLAWILYPEDFGLFGLASVMYNFVVIFGDVGTGALLIHRQERPRESADTAFWINGAVAVFLSAVIFALSPFAARTYGVSDVQPLLAVMAVAFLLQRVSAIHLNLLRKFLHFRTIVIISLMSEVISLGVVIWMALAGLGAWSFVFAMVAGNLVSAGLLFFLTDWRPRWTLDAEMVKANLRFGWSYLGQALLWYIVFSADKFLAGKFLGAYALGIYGLAYNYALLPVTLIGMTVEQVFLPALAMLQDNAQKLQETFLGVCRVTVCAVFPLAVTAGILAPELFHLVFGERWAEAILPFQMLLVQGAMLAAFPVGAVFIALGRTDVWFRVALMTAPMSIVSCSLGLLYGVPGVAAAMTVAVVGGHLMSLILILRLLALDYRSVLHCTLPYVLASLGTGAGLLALRFWAFRGLPDLYVVLGGLPSAAAVYLVVVRRVFPTDWMAVKAFSGSFLRRSRPER